MLEENQRYVYPRHIPHLIFSHLMAGPQVAKRWFQECKENTKWTQGTLKVYNRECTEPRLTAYFSDISDYKYSGKVAKATPFGESKVVSEILNYVHQALRPDIRFNSCLMNYYRNGDDRVGWHSDNDALYGEDPIVATVTLGVARDFDMRFRADHSKKCRVTMQPGSLLLMGGSMQRYWHHQIPPRKRLKKNLRKFERI